MNGVPAKQAATRQGAWHQPLRRGLHRFLDAVEPATIESLYKLNRIPNEDGRNGFWDQPPAAKQSTTICSHTSLCCYRRFQSSCPLIEDVCAFFLKTKCRKMCSTLVCLRRDMISLQFCFGPHVANLSLCSAATRPDYAREEVWLA